ncbi:hypothetical protein V8C86DRAFT_1825113 [Haematococcus lacustris]
MSLAASPMSGVAFTPAASRPHQTTSAWPVMPSPGTSNPGAGGRHRLDSRDGLPFPLDLQASEAGTPPLATHPSSATTVLAEGSAPGLEFSRPGSTAGSQQLQGQGSTPAWSGMESNGMGDDTDMEPATPSDTDASATPGTPILFLGHQQQQQQQQQQLLRRQQRQHSTPSGDVCRQLQSNTHPPLPNAQQQQQQQQHEAYQLPPVPAQVPAQGAGGGRVLVPLPPLHQHGSSLLQAQQRQQQQQEGAEGLGLGGCGGRRAADAPGPSQGQQGPGGSHFPGCGLAGNGDVLTCKADWLYQQGAYEACYEVTAAVLQADPYALQAVPLHLSACCVLGKRNELFMRGHKLVAEHPDLAVAWFAVGTYYMATCQFDQARRYFGKATSMDPLFAPAWVAFGHAFSAQDERDQAMAAYRTAARLFPGLHLPVMAMGMEYGAMNNLQLAERMLVTAHELCPHDPLTCHELGVLCYKNGQYPEAESWLRQALQQAPKGGALGPNRTWKAARQEAKGSGQAGGCSIEELGRGLGRAWEPCVLALGHCLRKQSKLVHALQAYNLALSLNPGQPGTLSAKAFTLHLMGDLQQAVQAYHAALAVRPDDPFTADMLQTALVSYSAMD